MGFRGQQGILGLASSNIRRGWNQSIPILQILLILRVYAISYSDAHHPRLVVGPSQSWKDSVPTLCRYWVNITASIRACLLTRNGLAIPRFTTAWNQAVSSSSRPAVAREIILSCTIWSS